MNAENVGWLKVEKRNQFHKPECAADQIACGKGQKTVEYADKQKHEHRGLNDSFVAHDAEIKSDGQENECDTGAVKRRNRQKIENGKACIQNTKIF